MKHYAAAFGAGFLVGAAAYVPAAQVFAPVFFEEPPVRVLFVGDLMLDRNVAVSARQGGAPALLSTNTRALFADADLRVLNLEGAVTTEPSIAQRNHEILRFTFDPALTRDVLAQLRVDAVSLANNHALDFFDSGFVRTREALASWGVTPFGHPQNVAGALSARIGKDPRLVCLVGYHALFAPDRTEVLAELARIRPECWRVVVFAHWGEEYQTRSGAPQQHAAHEFVDAGADLVIGAHPHVVQEVEVYQGRAIFYSLGNFMFDQNFSWETTHGLAVRVDFYEHKTAFTLVPLTVAEQHSIPTAGQDRERVLRLTGLPLSQNGKVAEFTLP